MTASSLLLFIGAGLLLNITPGPDMLYVTARTLGQGRAGGVVSSLGIFAGCFFHVFAAALGLTALLAAVPWAFTAIRWVGAAYLIWIGIRTLLDRSPPESVSAAPALPLARVFMQGVVTNVLNPKVALFFLAFLPQFIDPAGAHPALQFLALGAIFNVNGLIVLLLVVLLVSRLHTKLNSGKWTQRLRLAMGVTFIGLGARLAITR